jgi:hypothetical protein
MAAALIEPPEGRIPMGQALTALHLPIVTW